MMERIFNNDPKKLLLDLEEFYRTHQWHQQGGCDKKGYACLVVAASTVRASKSHTHVALGELYEAFMTYPKVEEIRLGLPYGTTNVGVMISFNDHPSTTWGTVQALFAHAKKQLQ